MVCLHRLAGLAFLGLAGLALGSGCQDQARKVAPAVVPAVPVSKPVQRNIIDFVDFTGRAEAVQAVDIRARVTGYLTKIPFKEGGEVKEGDLLFEIDPRPYQAQYDQAQGQLNLNLARLKFAQTTYARDQAIARGGAGAVSQQQLDQDKAAVDEAEARVKAYQASMEIYKLNLDCTKVRSPIDGQVSRTYLTPGNPRRTASSRCTWVCKATTATRTAARSTSSTTRAIQPRAASRCAACFRIPGPRAAAGC